MFGEGDATVIAAAIAACASVVGPIALYFVTRKIRQENTEQHDEGQRRVGTVLSEVLELHHKVDHVNEKVDEVDSKLDALAGRVQDLEES